MSVRLERLRPFENQPVSSRYFSINGILPIGNGFGPRELPAQFHIDVKKLCRNQRAVNDCTQRRWIIQRSALETVLFTQIDKVFENRSGSAAAY